MKPLTDMPLSVLDLVPIRQGGTAADAYRHARDLARHAERCGYRRYWVAEHHSIPGVGGAAAAVVIAHVAAATTTIRVGAGGIMLPNHAPLVVAEQFGTLAAMHPGRIDLGLGRAPGGDRRTVHALRRDPTGGDAFPHDLAELRGYFRPGGFGNGVHAVPGEGEAVPVYLLGSSDFTAQLAAALGLPFAFASHFAPDLLHEALALYRRYFEPSDVLNAPYVMAVMNVFAAGTDAEARRLFTTAQQAYLNLIRGVPGPLLPPVDSMDGLWSPVEKARVDRMTRCSAVGTGEAVRAKLEEFAAETGADELVLTGHIFDPAARLRSFELAAAGRF